MISVPSVVQLLQLIPDSARETKKLTTEGTEVTEKTAEL